MQLFNNDISMKLYLFNLYTYNFKVITRNI